MLTRRSQVVVLLVCSVLLLGALGCGSGAERAAPDDCDGSASEATCYAADRDPGSAQIALATDIAHRYMEEHPAEEELFDWRSGVLMFALTELHRVTGDDDVRAYYQDYLDHHVDAGYEVLWSDSCPPALTALALLAESEDPRYERVVLDVLDYLRDAPRTADGGISHLGPALTPPASIWVDSLFMFGMVLNRRAEVAADDEALDLLGEQLGVFAEHLQSDSGLFVHADGWPAATDDVHWARGNGWALVASAEYLRVLYLRGASDPQATQAFEAQVRGVLETQDPTTGMWWTVMDRPGSAGNHRETSATALLAYGLARAYRYGLVGEHELGAARRAVEGIEAAVRRDELGRPYVTGISEGTTPTGYDGYVQVPVRDDLSYGVGAVILALVETSGL